ncbi:MAG: HEPN domain-containing protein [Deltaproteobacteria bacterium]|nr:HEPN domain-containing protein [Deltaproteobacteria bacterium]
MSEERQQLYNKWLLIANKDLVRADAAYMRKDSEFVYFHCQQAVEKLAKGIYILLVSPKIPRVHSINDIIKLFESHLEKPVDSEMIKLFAELSNFYISGRYPDEFGDLICYSDDEEEYLNLLTQTKEAFQCLLKAIPKQDSEAEDQEILSEPSKQSPKP